MTGARIGQACLGREPSQVGAAAAPSLVSDAVEVGAHRGDADEQLLGNVLVPFPGCDEGQDFALPVRQPQGRGARAPLDGEKVGGKGR